MTGQFFPSPPNKSETSKVPFLCGLEIEPTFMEPAPLLNAPELPQSLLKCPPVFLPKEDRAELKPFFQKAQLYRQV